VSHQRTRLLRALADSGFKLTRPRRAVLEVLSESHEHLAPEDILVRGRQRYARLSRPTVYREIRKRYSFRPAGRLLEVYGECSACA
jgi:Fe2+ or Zn2+ uptake regulation protein